MPAEHEEGLRFSAIPLKSLIRRSTGFRYAFAIMLAFVAVCAQFLLERLVGAKNNIGTYQFFLGATALSALWTGRSGGLVTLFTSTVLALYFFIPPSNSLLVDSYIAGLQLILFVTLGMVVCLVGGALQASQEAFSLTLNSI